MCSQKNRPCTPKPGQTSSKPGTAPATVGETIAAYRRRRIRQRTGEPWSQEELALACETNQAHISRIESNRKHPQYSTLVRLCEALDLPAPKRSYLLALAGYPVYPTLPGPADVERLTSEIVPVLQRYSYPALLMDVGERVWYVNPLLAQMWGEALGGSDHGECMHSIRGRRTLEFVFDPRFMPVWKGLVQNLERVMDRCVSLFWRAYHLHPQEADMDQVLVTLKCVPEFLQRWQDLEEGKENLLLVEHDWLPIRHPRFGNLRFMIWRTTLATDERFILAHFPPADKQTRQAIKQAIEVPAAGFPCMRDIVGCNP
ncbi:MAG TPA: helix-turn-helix transcriptional regulator [Bryobacteraceae bacterium]|nr:helix-turn-helix transcriptional regulator [Bryobacteraceae bacterium]